MREARRFAVNVLRAGQEDIAAVFASKRVAARSSRAATHTVEHGVPVLDGALAWLVCELRELLPGGDHTIGIGARRPQLDTTPTASRWSSSAAVRTRRLAGPRPR